MKLRGRPAGLLVVPLALIAAISCDKATINPNDSSPPKIEMKVKNPNGQFESATSYDMWNNSDFSAVASDTDGVKSVSLSFTGSKSDSCTVGSSVYNGVFYINLPNAQQQDLAGDQSGKVLTTLPLFSSVEFPSCDVLGVGKGVPIGHTIVAKATGTNWSSNSSKNTATAEMKITIRK